MIDPRIPAYEWGQRVVAEADLYNDGSYPDREAEALLVERGRIGEIVQIGMHADTDTPVYLVEFAPGVVIGCLEGEIHRAG